MTGIPDAAGKQQGVMTNVLNDAVDLSLRQFIEAWQVMCSGGPAYIRAEGDGVECVFSGLPLGFFNTAFLTGKAISGADLKAHAHDACQWAADQRVPWLLVVTHDTLQPGTDAVAVLDECGLAPMMLLTGMLAHKVAPVTTIPAGLHLLVPKDDAGCSAVIDVNSAAYGIDLDGCKGVLGVRSFWQDHVAVLGVANGKPASSATVLRVDGLRYVALVATDPGRQRRGFAEATTRYALDVSAREYGERPTVLHASEAGRPVYQRMGYVAISTHTLFIEKRFLDAVSPG